MQKLNVMWLLVSLAACKAESPLYSSPGKPTVSDSQDGLKCDAPQPDPDNPQNPPILTCTLDFGGVPIGQSMTANLDIGNAGAATYQISSITDPSDLQFTVLKPQLPADVPSNIVVPVTFKPFSEDALSDSITLLTNSNTFSKLIVRLRGSGITIGVSVRPTSIDFGRVIIHSTETRTLTVTNLSSGAITLSPMSVQGPSQALFSIAVAGADFTPSYDYSMQIPPTQSVTFKVSFSPIQASSADESAYVVVSYASGKFVPVGLKGLGVKSGLCLSTVPVTSPLNISFGHVPLNDALTKTLYVENCSNEVLTLYESYLNQSDGEVFTVAQPGGPQCPSPTNCQQIKPSDGAFTLQHGEVLTYPITFEPLQGQGYLGAFTVQDDHGDNVTVPISGGGGGPDIVCQTLPSTSPLLLDFGLVATGVSTTLPLFCTNTGNDITLGGKIDPSGELQILESGLAISPGGVPFSAQLFVDGLNTSLVALRSGQSFQIQVTYDPLAGPSNDSGLLTIATNSQVTPLVQVALRGGSVPLTDCNLTLSPTALDFAQINVGQTVRLPVTLINAGNNACLIDGLALAPSTDPAFTIAGVSSSTDGTLTVGGQLPPHSIKLCGATEAASDNCQSAYGSSYQVLVQFQPSEAGSYQGLLEFVVSSHESPSQIVPLSGGAVSGCLVVTPQELDFGNVGIKSGAAYCKTNSRPIRALNTCGYPLEVTGLTNSAQSSDFRVSFSPALPMVVQSGQLFEFDEQFDPTTAGAKYGSASIVAAPAGGGVSQTYLAAFHGTASDTRQQVDTYVIPASKVDILWVVDFQNMYEMSTLMGLNPFQPGTGLSQSLGSFFSALSGTDYQVAVVSSVDCTQVFAGGAPADFVAAPNGAGLLGDLQMLPCSGCTDSNANNAQLITGSDAHPAAEMSDILTGMVLNYFGGLNLFWSEGNCQLGNGQVLGGDALQPAFDALTANELTGHNKGFLREDAALVLIALNMEDDTSSNLTGNPLSFYTSYFQNLKGFNPLTPFIFNAISITPGEAAARQSSCPGNPNLSLNGAFSPDVIIPALVGQTGGQLVDACTTDWASALASLGQTSSARLTSFTVSGSPVNPPTGIQVAIATTGGPPVNIPQYTVAGGAAIWTYDQVTGTLTFPNIADAPAPTDTLTITYTNVCY